MNSALACLAFSSTMPLLAKTFQDIFKVPRAKFARIKCGLGDVRLRYVMILRKGNWKSRLVRVHEIPIRCNDLKHVSCVLTDIIALLHACAIGDWSTEKGTW